MNCRRVHAKSAHSSGDSAGAPGSGDKIGANAVRIRLVAVSRKVPAAIGAGAGDYRGAEWAGACFSDDGRWLFANIYSPGFSVAITGPWGGLL